MHDGFFLILEDSRLWKRGNTGIDGDERQKSLYAACRNPNFAFELLNDFVRYTNTVWLPRVQSRVYLLRAEENVLRPGPSLETSNRAIRLHRVMLTVGKVGG